MVLRGGGYSSALSSKSERGLGHVIGDRFAVFPAPVPSLSLWGGFGIHVLGVESTKAEFEKFGSLGLGRGW